MIEYQEPLSPTGALRRERILQIAQRAARTRRHKRYFMRTVPSVACAIAIGVLILHRTNSPSMNTPALPSIAQDQTSNPASTIVIERIETDPTIADRLSVLPRAAQWQQIGDDELLQSLAKAGQPAGLIQMDGNTILVTDSDSLP